MIDNIILLLIGTLHNRPIAELLHKCHPLGSFAQMEAVTIATTVEELYSAVLIDTPIGTVLFFYHATLHEARYVLRQFWLFTGTC